MFAEKYAMDFLHERGVDKNRSLTEKEQEICEKAYQSLKKAQSVLIYLGGKAGRIGECVVGTGLLEGSLQVLMHTGKVGIAVTIVVDQGVMELFDEFLYQKNYWSAIRILSSEDVNLHECYNEHMLVLDFHGAHDGMPCMQIDEIDQDQGKIGIE